MNIVYYNPKSLLITQLSPVIDKHSLDPYIVLDARDQELLEKNKFIPQRFTVEVIDQEQNVGKLVEVNKNSNASISIAKIEKFFLVPYNLPTAEITFKQNVSNNTITVLASNINAKSESFSKSFLLAACAHHNPYCPIWTQTIDPKLLLTGPNIIPYQGSSDFRLYVLKTFTSYSHEL